MLVCPGELQIQSMDTEVFVTNDCKAVPKSKIYDSVFTNLFSISEYAVQLYQGLHPEDEKLTKEQVKLVTLENVLLNQPYNDIGMMILSEAAEGKMLIMCEAQSTWSMNILVRMLLYWAQTLQEYIAETRQNVYGSKKVRFPDAEFYVIYTGDRKTVPEMLTLAGEFGTTHVDIQIKVICDGRKGDIINQYVTFTRIYKEQYRLYGRTKKTVLETIRICIEQNVLKDYLQSRRKEVVDIMMTLFDDETIMKAYTKEIRDEGWQAGRENAQRDMALALADKGMALDVIAEIAKVSVETVKQWIDGRMAATR